MSKPKYSYDFVKKFFADNDCELLDKTYKDEKLPLNYKCKCGNIYKKAFRSFYKNQTCASCGNSRIKHTYQFIKKFFADNGCELIEETYKNKDQILSYKCKCGRIAQICFASFRNGRRCMDCGGKRQLTLEQVKTAMQQEGFILLASEYKNCFEKMPIRCPNGHEYKTHWNNWQSGRRCKKCAILESRGWVDTEEYIIRLIFKRRSYSLLATTLKAFKHSKNGRTHELLGYTPLELRKHITSHPNWENVKHGRWEIDHIFPIRSFLDYNIIDFKIVNCLENLQPILKLDNLVKRDKYDKNEFEEWLNKKGINYTQ